MLIFTTVAGTICTDLVPHEKPGQNALHELLLLAPQHTALLNMMIAVSALYMSNKCLIVTTDARSSLSYPSGDQHVHLYRDALHTKQTALYLLRTNLSIMTPADIDPVLSVILLLIHCELLDSSGDDCKHHLSGARKIIDSLNMSDIPPISSTRLRNYLISNITIFNAFASTFASSSSPALIEPLPQATLSLLQDAEGEHCSSFPTVLLSLITTASSLSHAFSTRTSGQEPTKEGIQQILGLLHSAQAFDPSEWCAAMTCSALDREVREHVAFAHRAAVCIYISRLLMCLDPGCQQRYDRQALVADILCHISFIQPGDVLFTATTWPSFIAGAEATDANHRDIVSSRLEELWEVEPWQNKREASRVLKQIWAERADQEKLSGPDRQPQNWLRDLQEQDVDWLIL